VGLAGTLYTAIFMSVRLLDGSYNAGGKFFAGLSISGQPSFGTTNSPIRALVLLSMLSTNYICHYNAPKFYTELKGASMKRFRLLSILGFGFSTLVTCFMMTVGFLTFGGNSLGLVLNNYAGSYYFCA
jgi:sodium-coupled neutral amino acid transporter 11